MSEGWRDYEPGRTGVSVASLADGETVKAQIIGEPYREDTSVSDNALHVPVSFVEVPDGFEDMSGEQVETASDNGEAEYNIINSSSAFFNALLEAFPADTTINGQIVEIEAHQPGDDYSRFYQIEAQ